MTCPAHIEAAIEDEGRFAKAGGSTVIDMAADRAGEIVNELELGEKAATRK